MELSIPDCYFYQRSNSDGKAVVSPLCVECHDARFPQLGWFWQGSSKGYGPWKFVCSKCDAVIHDPETGDAPLN